MDERTTIWVTGDQCTPHNTALAGIDRARARVLMIESIARSRQKPYHKQKLALIFAAMRSYADDLRREGWDIDYYAEREDFETPLGEHVASYRPGRVRMMTQSEYGVDERMRGAVAVHGLALDVFPHANFASSAADFEALFARGAERVTMETFYRAMRRKTGLLMDGDAPAGGAWNFDADNRRPPARGMRVPALASTAPGAHARDAIAMVARRFPEHPGSLDGFDLPVSRAEALAAADAFFDERLDLFGPYEDAMLRGEPQLYHSRLSAAINVGLLHPLELCERAELAYRTGRARLASVEGFVRQLIGWREFIWQTYWKWMPEYRTRNALGATLPLPAWWFDGETMMACQRAVLGDVLARGWTHHIPRLMVLGNFALLAGCEPQATTDWFWYMFVDGYDWVMVPNVVGMTLHADGGIVGTKPYAASANYINKMSDFCGGCRYDRRQSTGENACPYNTLYWDFIGRHEQRFARNPRMSLPVRNWRAKDMAEKRAIRSRAASITEMIAGGGRL